MTSAISKPKPSAGRTDELIVELKGLGGRAHIVPLKVRDVVAQFLKVAGLTGRFTYSLKGFNHATQFARPPGIKIKPETDACCLIVFVGGDDQYAGYLYAQGDGGLIGLELFRRLEPFTQKRYFYPVDNAGRTMETLSRMAHKSSHEPPTVAGGWGNHTSTATQISAPEPEAETEPVIEPEQPEQTAIEDSPGAQDAQPTDPVKQLQEEPKQYRFFLDDPKKMHTAVVGLVLACNESVNVPFTTKQFIKWLVDAGVPEETIFPPIIVRVFMTRDFIVRINDITPARYSITAKAIEFANGTPPNEPVPTLRVQRIKEMGNKPPKQPMDDKADMESRIKTARAVIDEKTKLESEMASAKRELASLNKDGIDDEEVRINGEIGSLERRLKVLRNGLKDITDRRNKISRTESDINHLIIKLSDPKFGRAEKDLERLKAQLDSMPKMIG